MRAALVVGAGFAVLVSAAASAGPVEESFQPAVTISTSFGGAAPASTRFAFRLDYSDRIQQAVTFAARHPDHGLDAPSARIRLPAAAEWTYDAGTHAVRMNGLTLGAGDLRLRAAEEGDSKGSFWGGNVGLMVLATGAAIAGIIAVAGDTAEDNNPAVNPPETPEGGGDTCVQVGPSDACTDLIPDV